MDSFETLRRQLARLSFRDFSGGVYPEPVEGPAK